MTGTYLPSHTDVFDRAFRHTLTIQELLRYEPIYDSVVMQQDMDRAKAQGQALLKGTKRHVLGPKQARWR